MQSLYVNLITIVVNLVLGLLVLFRNPKNSTNKLFFWFILSIILWIGSLFLLYHPEWNIFPLLQLGRFNYLIGVWAVYLLYAMSRNFPRKITSKTMNYVDLGLVIETLTLSFVTMFTPLIDRSEEMIVGVLTTTYGSLFIWFVIHFLGIIVASMFILVRKYKYLSQGERFQTKLLFLGFMITVVFAAGTNLIIPLIWGYTGLQEVGPTGTVIMAGLIGYAIVWHRLLDVTALVARAVNYFFLLLVVVGVEVIGVYWLTKLLPAEVDRVMVAVGAFILLIMSFDMIKGSITRLTERIFFQSRYDTEDLLAKLTKVMAAEIELTTLTGKLTEILVREMRLSMAKLIAKHEAESDWKLWILPDKIWIFDDMVEGEMKEILREKSLRIVIPLFVKDELVGVLALGPKSSGEIYLERDVEVMSIFAAEVAVAIKNAQSYKAIQEFSKTLEKKVDERTGELKVAQEEQLRLKDEFVFIASHDLAAPVTTLTGYIDIIDDRKIKLDKQVQEMFGAMREAGERLKDLVDDLLQVARGDSGTMRVETTSVNLPQVIERVVRLLSQNAKMKKITLINQVGEKSGFVIADEAKIEEILENLITNAIKYNKAGGKVEISSSTKDGWKTISIEDNGIGIPKDEQIKVFSKFFRSESKATRTQPGTGLGLFVVRMLVEKMGGKVSFESEEGKGSCFHVQLRVE